MKEKLVALVQRHGETDLNDNGSFRSWLDIPLNDKGIKQAEKARDYLKRFKIKQVISSPLIRAVKTATIISEPHDLYVFQDRGLFPWRLGIFSGLPRDEHQEALRLFVQNPMVCIPSGESLDDFQDRQYDFWKQTLDRAKSNNFLTLFVCHTSNITAFENFTEDMEETEPEFGESVKPGGVGAIYWNGTRYCMKPIFGETEEAKFGGS